MKVLKNNNNINMYTHNPQKSNDLKVNSSSVYVIANNLQNNSNPNLNIKKAP